MVTFAATSARQSYTISAGQRRSRRCPAERKRKGRRPVVATNVRLPRASRGHPGPANAHGLPVGLLRSPLPPRSPAPLPNAHGLPVGWLRSLLRQRANCTPSPPGSGGAAAARRREREGGAAVCSDKREAPTGKPWASRPCQCPRLAVGTVTFAATRAVVRPAPKCPRLARGIVTLAATSARQSYIHLRRAAAEPPLPGGKKRKGRRPVVAANVRLPRASRGHPGPANAHGLTVGLLRSPLSPRSPASLPNAHGLPVGWLRSPLRQRGNCTPISAGQRRSRRCPAERKGRGGGRL